ncbi:DUF4044 domain-containing protein [Lactobacillus sp. PV037]|nr:MULTISPECIES: DUF4044 domain-containing protein [unclassified Lactobacillus]QNQ82467.1 DUF4044 domain-containing protein [Lactobacillus sp. PV012]QNQ83419.1 DUF4044 domain-containing protein [Lactobacillus sp. PV037]
MAKRRRKKKTPFQVLTIIMAFIMALITLFGVVGVAFNYMFQ